MNFDKVLNELINNISHPLKSGKELELALKAKLTKKEFKLLKLKSEKLDNNTIKEKLKFDNQELERVDKNLIKKINQERVKQEFYNI